MWFLLPFLLLTADFSSTIRDYLILKDYLSAEKVCIEGLTQNPNDIPLTKLLIETFAKEGKEREMLKVWKGFYALNNEAALDHDLLEKMAWGVIEKGNISATPLVRLFAMLAAVFSQDIQGVHLLIRELKSDHSGIRAVALQLAAMLGDDILKPAITELFRQEKVFDVRLAAIKTVGQLRMKELKGELEKLASNDKATFEERTAAIEALILFHDKVLPFELQFLLKSEKVIHKLVGLRLAPKADFEVHIDDIVPLLQDNYYEVRLTALHTLGLLFTPDPKLLSLAENHLKDPNGKVQIVALWLKTLINPKNTTELWVEALLSSKEEERQLAAALAPSLGKKTVEALSIAFYNTDDPITQVNLGLGLIKQRREVESASQQIIELLNQKNALWMWKEIFGQKVIATSDLPAASFQSPPLDVHRLCQLEILALLSIFDPPVAREGILKFLRQRNFQVSGIALALLLTEFSEDAANVVRPLVEDATYPNRAEACVLMALWSGDASMRSTMESLYNSSDRKRKEFLLEAFGRLSGTDALPFLVEKLGEPYPTLRMIAASSIIQCLNH